MQKIRRVLSPLDAASLGIGIVVGTGIFAVPGSVARELGNPGAILLAWLLGGVFACAGALTYAELATMFPRQGGGFRFVLEAFGPFAAFFKGWGSFLVGYPASSAGIATLCGIYFVQLAGITDAWVKPVAAAACTFAWLFNLRGTRFSARAQTVMTLAKVTAIAALAVAGVALSGGDASRLFATTPSSTTWPGLAAFAAAFVGILWTFDGWQNLAVVAGEMERPEKSITSALVMTIALVTGLYLTMNVAYLVALPLEDLAASTAPATLVVQRIAGENGSRLLAALVVLSSFGALFGVAIAGSRYFFALGESGLFFRGAAAVDPETQAPRWGATALLLTSLFYIATGSFEEIIAGYVVVSLVYNMLSMAAVFRLRATRPELPRPFRVPGYPAVPALAIAAGLFITGSEVLRSPARSLLGFALLFAAWPAYLAWRSHRSKIEGGDS